MFDPTSRYYTIETAKMTMPDGRVIAYKRRRFASPPDTMPVLAEVLITQGDRLDLIAARTLGEPEQFWRICDANNVLDPEELTATVGRILRVPVPQI
jgi:hypothetical protein